MMGAQIVLACDVRRQTSRILPAFFPDRLSTSNPEIYFSSCRWVLKESMEKVLIAYFGKRVFMLSVIRIRATCYEASICRARSNA
jgi:hypothetical protein